MAMALILGLGPWWAQVALGARGLSPTGVGRGAVRDGQGLTPACLGGPTVRLSRPGGWIGARVKAGVPEPREQAVVCA